MRRPTIIIVIILFCLISISGFGQNDGIVTSNYYPKLRKAEIPFYPPIAATMRFGGTVVIDVVVEDGIIKETKIKSETMEPPQGKEEWLSNHCCPVVVRRNYYNTL